MPIDPQKLEAVFEAARIRTAGQREACLEAACEGDAELRASVDALLLAHDEAGLFLEPPEPPPPMHFTPPGTVIGRYRILECIGEGGYGTVFMAEQTTPVQRKVALKIVKPGMDTRQVIARFEAERQTLALMDHPNIAKVFDAGVTDTGRPYFVMELVKGIAITKYCDEHRLPPRVRLELFVQVCQAVQHAHQKGIIHRDIKPSNVLIARYDGVPVPKVIDFGVAKATGQRLTEATMFTGFGDVIGTLEYMSPEQAEMNQLDVDTRSDIYSLGVLLYELLTGTTPLEKERIQRTALLEALRFVREEEPPKPSTRLSTAEPLPGIAANRGLEPKKLSGLVRGELDWIVMKALEKDRARRYETANALANDVQRFLKDEAVQACPPSARYRLRKFTRKYRVSLTVAAGFVSLLIAATVVSSWQTLRARRAEVLAQARFETEKQARSRAVTEAAKATAIRDLLQEMLTSADPDQAKGGGYTVRQLLDDSSLRLRDQLKDQPEVEAEVRATMGLAYRGLGLTDQAEPHLQAALDLRRRVFGPDSEKVAESLIDHAFNQHLENPLEAEASAREAMRIYKSRGTAGRPVIHAIFVLENSLVTEGKSDDAEAVATEAVALCQSTHAEYPELANILHRLADVKLGQKKYAEAEEFARRAVEMHRRVQGNEHPQTAWGLLSLAGALRSLNKDTEAESALRESLAIFRRYYNEDHMSIRFVLRDLNSLLQARGDRAALASLQADTAARLSKALAHDTDLLKVRIQLAHLSRDGGKLDEALANLTEAVKLAPASRSEMKLSLADEFSRLGGALKDQQKPEQAERALRQAISLREPLASDAPPAPRLALSFDYNTLAFVLPAERLPEAERAIRNAIELKQALVRDFPRNGDFRVHLAHSFLGLDYIVQASGRTVDAITAAGEAAKVLNDLAGDTSATQDIRIFLGHTLWQLGEAWLQLNRLDDARNAQQTALKLFVKLSADDPAAGYYRQEQAYSHRYLATTAERAGRIEDAEQHLREALSLYRALITETPGSALYQGEAAFTARALADLLLRARKYEQAEPLLLAEYADLQAHPAPPAAQWRDLLDRITEMYRNWGENQKLADWQANSLAAVNRALTRSPNDVGLQIVRGHLLRDSGELQQAVAQFSQVLTIAVPPADAWSGRARAYFDLQQWERAIADFSKAIELAPKVQTNWFHRGLSYVQLGQWDKAAADFDKASEGWPADAESWYWRGAAHARMAQPDEAVRCLRQAVAHGFKDARRMRSNVNFETLRAVDDYKKLLTDLDKVAHPVPTTQKSGN